MKLIVCLYLVGLPTVAALLGRGALLRGVGAAALGSALPSPAAAGAAEDEASKPKFKRPPQGTQFIAALGDPQATSGTGAEKWGLWREDPGPRGVWLRNYNKLASQGFKAPAGWQFDPDAWWVEEHGLIMETPEPLPLRKGKRGDAKYVVTGGRETTSVLTVHDDGRWELSKGKLYDVTHLPCRSAVYTAATAGAAPASCVPTKADQQLFPVKPGAAMPDVPDCARQDHAVLFVVGIEA